MICTAGDAEQPESEIYVCLQEARSDGQQPVTTKVYPSFSIPMLKLRLRQVFPYLTGLKDHEFRLLYKGIELKGNKNVGDFNFKEGTGEDPVPIRFLVVNPNQKYSAHKRIKYPCEGVFQSISGSGVGKTIKRPKPGSKPSIYRDQGVECPEHLLTLMECVRVGMECGVSPVLTPSGTGGTYMMMSRQKSCLAMFKPRDEEAFAPNNPRNFVGLEDETTFRNGVYSTHQSAREVAAYLLDHHQFANVPETTVAHARHEAFNNGKLPPFWKVGALQEFIGCAEPASDYGTALFDARDVRRIAMLDIRLLNLDRNDENILVVKRSEAHRSRDLQTSTSKYRLVAIDHGLSLPNQICIPQEDVCWMAWGQSDTPFDQEELDYIQRLDPLKDARRLHESLGISEDSCRLMEVTSLLLKIGARQGLRCREIGSLLYRNDDTPSEVENVLIQAMEILPFSCPTLYKFQSANQSSFLSALNLESFRGSRQQSRTDVERPTVTSPTLGDTQTRFNQRPRVRTTVFDHPKYNGRVDWRDGCVRKAFRAHVASLLEHAVHQYVRKQTVPENLVAGGVWGTPRYGVGMAQGPRDTMEDMVVVQVYPNMGELYMVLDGHGGEEAVTYTSYHFPRVLEGRLVECFAGTPQPSEAELMEVLAEAFLEVDRSLVDFLSCKMGVTPGHHRRCLSQPDPNSYSLTSGSTACAVLVCEPLNLMIIGQLGDCTALVCRAGQFHTLTAVHRADEPGEKERLHELGVPVDEEGYVMGRVAISRAFGDLLMGTPYKSEGITGEPDVQGYVLSPEDEFILVVSDGALEMIPTTEVMQICRRHLRAGKTPKEVCSVIVDQCLCRKGSDNVSVILVRRHKPPMLPQTPRPVFDHEEEGG